MPSSPNRRRIEIDAEVYDMLEREARWLHIPVSYTATMLLREALAKLKRDYPPALREVMPESSVEAVALMQERQWREGQ